MASYIESNLTNDERIIKWANVSWWSQLKIISLGIIIFLFCAADEGAVIWGIVILIMCFIIAFIRVKTTELALTNKRVIAKFGFISRDSVDLRLEKVESLSFSQDILGRIFNFGYIVINGAGNKTPIPFISKPIEFKKAFENFLDEKQ
ncbi:MULTISPECIES: PH domain-containing protein [unclassified Campylobacter]|uniref:PH domain-containing protein n=1 Tax=unclassified Campylobacter TaxID=2593542 RepID=UPI0022E9A335|nr:MULTISPECIES: PH domain-containing protein [unclassified Campylobacter]MDA3043026.1 PH domain-containing protein [Campylobacter sp. JMF_09 ED2]MDA3044936.1 PH domain-containing protein [Campylobacter sp. JMF_07 ED4]MDA3063972.1 PH domain-containing protein [Campylobacter sp. JMF_11 EL3]MDA3072298.1 PH domain-containing protein [Campylobacter sp. VBCF_03 NA9]MDA3074997.1 PH domain-containing protein [Campylobacter sp. JMF_05 ED3]